MAVTLEILGMLIENPRYIRFNQDKITIGRGYNNDLVLSDGHICACHAEIEQRDNQWYLSDLSSVNGTHLGKTKSKPIASSHALKSGDVFKIGRTRLRFLLADHEVAKAKPFIKGDHTIERYAKPLYIWLLITLNQALGMLVFYFNHTNNHITFSKMFAEVLMDGIFNWLLLVVLWLSIVAAFQQAPRIKQQLTVTYFFLLIYLIASLFATWFLFNAYRDWLDLWLQPVLLATLLFIGINISIKLNFSILKARKRWFIAAVVVGFHFFVSFYAPNFSQEETFSSAINYHPELLAPAFRIASPTTPQAFWQEGKILFAEVDQKIKEKKKRTLPFN